ncbi:MULTISPECIES: light-harvesting protein [Cereibacter]|uniref:Antenna pigment protein alpha chain n=1 Tax=Cereibacter johrii TaxID=445629 RepID=A0ABX5JEV1_9RHOB|nr:MULTISPECIES: light-harvesting protein [Cereibacter]QCP85002.1 light-harvesting protein [Cereibacter sphaeroides]RDS94596.1 light-harvesting protein [Cereibacter sphaeroides f. sp. denitrificans]MEA5161098.1 light-harvesting protein [Cereibacter johrii]ODM42621.1 light-harvesting protein [Cereibacter johrii]PTM80562.1 light-harvesting protein B-800-850 alpha chain [Cereibacter johrii]
MTNGKIWLVVKPTVGVPLFLSAAVIASVVVHAAVLTTTTWLPDYYQGSAKVAAE